MKFFEKLFKKKEKIFVGGSSYYDKGIIIIMKEDYPKEQESLSEKIKKHMNKTDYKGSLRSALKEHNAENFNKVEGPKSFLAGFIKGDRFYLAQGGNARFYIVRDNELSLISADDTQAFNLFNNEVIEYEETVSHQLSESLTKGIGMSKDLDMNIYEFYLKERDIILLTEKNIVKELGEERLESILLKEEFNKLAEIKGSYIVINEERYE